MKVRASGLVEVSLPKRVTMEAARKFVRSELNWIEGVFENIEPPVKFEEGAVVPIRGKDHRICHQAQSGAPVSIETGVIFVSGGKEHLARRLTDWLKKNARSRISERAEYYAAKAGVRYGRITIRDQKSRWGSCSSTGNLNFSWRLYLMPDKALDYVVAHEIAHIRHMNHSPEFWALVARICPHMDESRRWMKKNAGRFHKYNATT